MSITPSETTQFIFNAARDAPWWDNNLIAGLTGAVIGAAISGSLSLYLQHQNFKYEKQIRNSEALDKDRATAYTVMHKVIRIEAYARALKKIFDETFNNPNQRETPAYYIKAPSSPLPRIGFDADELGMIQRTLGGSKVTPLLKIDSDYDIIVGSWSRYGEMYTDTFFDWTETTLNGHPTMIPLPPNASSSYRKANSLHKILSELHVIVNELHDASTTVILEYTKHFNEKLRLNLTAVAVTTAPQPAA